MDTFAERLTCLRAESERFTQYLRTLPAEAWSRPSACTQWQVQDVVAHLVGVAEFYADTVARGLQGDASPPQGRPPAGSVNAAMTAESLAKRTIAARKRLANHLLATFEATNERLNHLLAGLTPEDRQKPCYHPGGMVPAQHFIDLRLKELALHEWDIRSRLEPDFHLSPASFSPMIELLAGSVASGSLRWGFWAGPALSAAVHYGFEVSGPVPYSADIIVEGDTARVAETGDTMPDVTFRCDTETFVLLVYGRLPLAEALDSGRLAVEGDRDRALAFGQWFKGI
jgi:uncharacterized protein (TIGR03083 family)